MDAKCFAIKQRMAGACGKKITSSDGFIAIVCISHLWHTTKNADDHRCLHATAMSIEQQLAIIIISAAIEKLIRLIESNVSRIMRVCETLFCLTTTISKSKFDKARKPEKCCEYTEMGKVNGAGDQTLCKSFLLIPAHNIRIVAIDSRHTTNTHSVYQQHRAANYCVHVPAPNSFKIHIM